MKKVIFIVLSCLVGFLFLLNISFGSVEIGIKEIVRILFCGEKGVHSRIVLNIRIPRALAALLLGGALSISGYLLQTFFSNPIAGPFVLGISHGAKLMVAMLMIFCVGNGYIISSEVMIMAAFMGSVISMGFILMVSGKVKSMSTLVICGIMIGYICSAITEFVITFADDANIVNLHNWSMGSFSGMTFDNIKVICVVIFMGVICSMLISKQISAYQLGESYARNLGVNIILFRVMLILVSSVLSATVTAFAGPVSFVGIAVPHLIRNLFKSTKPMVMIFGCFLGGGAFCLFCDFIARTVFAPVEMSISTVTAIFGAPVVIVMLIRKARV